MRFSVSSEAALRLRAPGVSDVSLLLSVVGHLYWKPPLYGFTSIHPYTADYVYRGGDGG